MISDEATRRGVDFGRMIAQLRKQACLSVEELATRLGCSCTTLAHIEANGADLTAERYLQVIYAVDPDSPSPLTLDGDSDEWGVW
jgi:transcriptional regulator with XRE-family HTH domain